ncbi:MAG TPA: alpha/beta hydrolase [Acidocella sp.]|jgi:pimeloyl-ACP methyl ester carboxylesterase|nr:alpha/beta hydrolase [Acidocella sp.]
MDYAFLHGGGQGGWVWTEMIEALALQSGGTLVRALALDVPGCGAKRGQDTSQTGVDDIAAELLSDIEAAGLRDVVLVGHSQAGSVMPHLLTARPELFRRAIYISCSIPLPGQTVVGMVGNSRHGENPDEIGWPLDPRTSTMEERYRIMFCNDMDDDTAQSFMGKLGADAWPMSSYAHTDWRHEQLGAVPSSYVACLRDGILPMPWQEIFARRFHCGRTVHIDAGHQVMNTRPHGLAEIVRHDAGG